MLTHDALTRFTNAAVKDTDYGPPTPKGVESLQNQIQHFSEAYLTVLEQTGLTIYLLERGQDPLGAGREVIDPAAFPTIQDRTAMQTTLEKLSEVDCRYQTIPWHQRKTLHSQYNDEVISLADSLIERFGVLGVSHFGITALGIGFVHLKSDTTLGEIASSRFMNCPPDPNEHIRFLEQIGESSPLIFQGKTFIDIASFTVHRIPPLQYCIIPGYTFVQTEIGRKCVLQWDANQAWKWHDPGFLSHGGALSKMRTSHPAIYFTSPLLGAKYINDGQIFDQDLPGHEFTHIMDVQLEISPLTRDFHRDLYKIAAETLDEEKKKGETENRLSAILLGYGVWSNVETRYIEQWRSDWSEKQACKELIGYTGGFIFADEPEAQYARMEQCNPRWANTFRNAVSQFESLPRTVRG